MFNISIIDAVFHWIEERAKNKFYVYFLTFFLVLISLFLATPKYHIWVRDFKDARNYTEVGNLKDNIKYHWDVVMLKSRDLTNPLNHINQKVHARNTVFRLTVPIIIKIFGLTPLSTYILQFLIGIVLIILLYRLTYRILNSTISATFLTVGMVFIYFGRVCFIDVFTQFDGWAYFFLILSMSFKKPVYVFFFSALAVLSDERAIFALGIVILFHQMTANNTNDFSFKTLIKLKLPSYASITAIVGYLLLRYYLTIHYDMHVVNSTVTNHPFYENNFFGGYLQAGLWSFLEGFWLIFFIVAGFAIFKKHYIFFAFLIIPMLVLGGGAFFLDVTRSGSYMVPIVFVFIAFLRHHMDTKDLQFLLFLCMIICIIYPVLCSVYE